MILVILIMLMVGLSFCVKLSLHRTAGILLTAFIAGAFIFLTIDYSIDSSKTQIESWINDPSLMLDMAVVLTIDVAMQIAFCIMYPFKDDTDSIWRRILFQTLYWLPGLLIFPVLFALLVEVIFSFPGADFVTLGLFTAVGVIIAAPSLAYLFKYLIDDTALRLETIFLLNALTGILGIVATVNGRTAATGTSDVNWWALATILALFLAGSLTGLFITFKTKKL